MASRADHFLSRVAAEVGMAEPGVSTYPPLPGAWAHWTENGFHVGFVDGPSAVFKTPQAAAQWLIENQQKEEA